MVGLPLILRRRLFIRAYSLHWSFTEPGYYADGRFGIRIESIVIVREVSTPYTFGDKGSYLGFEHVTLSPIHTKLVDVKLMSPVEVDWLNEYHKEVWEKVSPGLKAVGDERAERWLEKECKPVGQRTV